jgi:fumarate reductase subunit D
MSIVAAGPAWAHLGSAADVVLSRSMMAPAAVTATSLSGTTGAAESHALISALLIISAVAIAAVSPRRRVLVASGLVLLLVVFALEDAMHSVHHGLGPVDAKSCAVAAASVHVTGTTVDAITAADLLPPSAEERRLERDVTRPEILYRSPVQQRAPPA